VSVPVCSRNLKGGGQGPIWVVVPLDGWICIIVEYIIFFSVALTLLRHHYLKQNNKVGRLVVYLTTHFQ
jgi:hypothetical protein